MVRAGELRNIGRVACRSKGVRDRWHSNGVDVCHDSSSSLLQLSRGRWYDDLSVGK